MNVLCEHHNGATGDLDAEAGVLSAAFRGFFDTHVARIWAPQLNWNCRSYGVKGLLIERWLMKIGINHLVSGHVPIGVADAAPGMPPASLVRMVYGREPVPREAGLGIFHVDHPFNAGDRFDLRTISRNDTHVSAIVLSYGRFHLGVNFEPREPT